MLCLELQFKMCPLKFEQIWRLAYLFKTLQLVLGVKEMSEYEFHHF